ncbi:MAG: ABC transporter ATP-binding protein [Ignavibacteria bacterium]|nr:ABC transporter ATP-binding protein [Ignavibacteria bacterium]
MIRINAVNKSFGKKKVLSDITTELKKGYVYALMGPNGSGKTTLLKIILGLVRPDSGQVRVDERDISNDFSYRAKIGYMPQSSSFPENLTVAEVISMLKDLKGENSATDNELLDKLKIESFISTQVGKLSGGMKQRLSCAAAFLFSPEIIILDEPTAGLDPVSSEIVRARIKSEKQKGNLVLITTHVVTEAEETADIIIYLIDGRIYLENSVNGIYKEANTSSLTEALAEILKNNF